jgi:hypothetical protein
LGHGSICFRTCIGMLYWDHPHHQNQCHNPEIRIQKILSQHTKHVRLNWWSKCMEKKRATHSRCNIYQPF